MRPSLFDLATTLLPTGPTLIEASAGTGKTFTLAGLFLRLLLEHDLSHRQILIVTYTEAATEELRGRIRERLAAAHEFLSATSIPGDSLFASLRQRLSAIDPDFRHARAKLAAALSGFDETPIHTIHGFCQRLLRDRAFESGSLFDVELVTDLRPLLDELIADWWRTEFAAASSVETGMAMASGLSPHGLGRLLDETLRHRNLRWCAEVRAEDLPQLRRELAARFAEAKEIWQAESAQIRSLFGDGADWANRPYNQTSALTEKFARIEACFGARAGADDFGVFGEFTPAALTQFRSKRRKAATPEHAFFQRCEQLDSLRRKLFVAWQMSFHDWTRTEWQRRKLEHKVQSFDDLLTRLDDALAGPNGASLASVVRSTYTAALIDEFQDTDPVQWRIFRRLFGGDEQRLFLIGDPKQAIYGFRGADVFTYLMAAAASRHRHTLGTNWRSEPGLVAALNGIFGRHPAPFVVREIAFHPSIAARKSGEQALTEKGTAVAPLQLWFRSADAPISKSKAEPQLAEMTASEIVRLIATRSMARIDGRLLRPSDIAVLVESHHQAELVATALRKRGVPCVQQTQRGVFASAEAEQLQTLLSAIAEPAAERRLRAALTTDFFALDAQSLASLAADESSWSAWRERFQAWLVRWQSAGFLPMFRDLMQTQHVRRRWLRLVDGERRLTNALHLAEMLHATATERRLGVNGLRQHLAHRCARACEAGDEEMLRLERDDNAVQLVTIHRSKGLEYPVVFCPFVFREAGPGRAGKSDTLVLCHDPDDRLTMLGDLGSSQRDDHERLAAEERLAENVRLLYVALTRARNRCYFAWGDFDRATTAPAWLLTPPPLQAGGSPVEALSSNGAPEAGSRLAAVEKLAAEVPDIAVSPPPPPTAQHWSQAEANVTTLVHRKFTAAIPRDWRVASFSWLTADRVSETPDYGTETAKEIASPEMLLTGTIHAFPRGTDAGTCLHKIFERLDFPAALADEQAMRVTVEQALREYGFDVRAFAPAVADLIRRTVSVPLMASQTGTPGLTLGQVPSHRRINELEFAFPLRRISPSAIRSLLGRHGAAVPEGFPEMLERLQFNPVMGLLRGFMDLVFQHEGRWWLVDWKSNWLGPSAEDYTPRAVAVEMTEHFYPLQYLLYTVALDRWLRLRVPGYDYARDFGGVRYLFLRGLDPSRPELGVFADKPSAALIRDLGELLLAPTEGGDR